MRHRVYGSKLGRNKDERGRLFKGLISELFLRGSIQTSSAKAKAIKGLVDRVINFAKEKNSQRLLQKFITNEALRDRLIKEIAPKIGNRSSGYTSLVRLGPRLGDQTMMVKMSLIGAEQLKPIEKVISDKRQVTSKKTETKKIVAKKNMRSKKIIRSTKPSSIRKTRLARGKKS